MLIVLAPIDEHFSFAQRPRHVRRDKIGMFSFEKLRECARHIFRLIKRDRGIERYINLQTFGAARFRKTFQFHFAEQLAQPKSDLTALHDVGWRARIEIKHHHGGLRDVAFARQRGVQFEIGQVRRPDERG